MELLIPSFGLIFWIIFFLGFTLWVIALIDLSRRDFESKNERILWGLLILFVPVLGTILYFAIGRKNKVKLNQS